MLEILVERVPEIIDTSSSIIMTYNMLPFDISRSIRAFDIAMIGLAFNNEDSPSINYDDVSL